MAAADLEQAKIAVACRRRSRTGKDRRGLPEKISDRKRSPRRAGADLGRKQIASACRS